MSQDTTAVPDLPADGAQDPPAPACVMSFNANDASGGGGLAGDVSAIAAMGSHPLPVVTSVIVRDTAEVFDHSPLEADLVVEQARSILEDVTLAAWKVGYLGSAEIVGAVAEILSDYPDVPLVAHMPAITWLDDDELQSYCDAFRDLVLPQTRLLVGSHQTLTDLLLPDWDGSRPASPRELAAAAAEKGTPFVLVTSMAVPGSGTSDQYIDNVLATGKGAVTGEKFERFDVGFVGAGDTLTAALAALLANGSEVHDAVGEALTFLDQSLDAGFRPGMGNVVPDRFFWAAQAPEDEADPEADGTGGAPPADDPGGAPKGPRQIH